MGGVCSLCGILLSEGTWAEREPDASAGSATRHSRARSRMRRVEAINRVLAHFGLRVRDWQSAAYVLEDAKGRQEIVEDLGRLWPAAERMAGRPLDPLDPALLARLRQAA
jgi:hypothetical protein